MVKGSSTDVVEGVQIVDTPPLAERPVDRGQPERRRELEQMAGELARRYSRQLMQKYLRVRRMLQ